VLSRGHFEWPGRAVVSIKQLFACVTVTSAVLRSHEIVGEHGGADPQLETVASFGEQRFMPRPRNSTEMRPSMPARKR
jgi:hypothetical protein